MFIYIVQYYIYLYLLIKFSLLISLILNHKIINAMLNKINLLTMQNILLFIDLIAKDYLLLISI